MPAERTLIIANPSAGAGMVGRILSTLEDTLRERLGPLEIMLTTAPGHGSELARDAIGQRPVGVTRVLSLGGDGTLSEVVHGVMMAGAAPDSVEIGLLPAGTGGDFRRLLGCANDVLSAVDAILDAAAVPVDVGHARFVDDLGEKTERYFINILSFGVGGLVDRLVNETPKHLGGRASFLIGTVRALLRYRPARVALELDGERVGEFDITNVFACNGRFGGGGMLFGPSALLDDGLLDVVCIENRSLLAALRMTPNMYRGTFDRFPGVTRWRAAEIRAHAVGPNPAYLDIDGEAPGVLPVEISVLPRALRLLAVSPEVLVQPSGSA